MDRQNKEGQQQTASPAIVSTNGVRSQSMMHEALKRHILRQRQKKKEEQEADAEVERQRKEIEAQQKQNVMTLEENREQMIKLEQSLAALKKDKHQLFGQLKKVIHEDDIRKKQLIRQQESSADVIEVMTYGGMYPSVAAQQPPPLSVSGHISHLVMQPSYSVADRNTLYKVPPSHTLLPPGSMKRARSPSPPPPQPSQIPPPSVYSQGFSQKLVTTRPSYQKSSPYGAYYPPPGTTGGNQTPYTFSSPQFASSSVRNDDGVSQGKHPVYLTQPLPRTSISQPYMHSSLEHKPSSYSEEKYYVGPIRPATHVPLHGGAIPIQQAAQGVKTGGITSGFPIRPPSSAPPPPHVVSSPASHSVYASQPPSSGSRLVYSQAGPSRYGQREV